MAYAGVSMPSTNSTVLQPPRRTVIISRVQHPTTRNFKLSVSQSGRNSLAHPSYGLYSNAAGSSSSLDCYQSTIVGAAVKQFSSALSERLANLRIVPNCKTLPFPFSVLARVGYVYRELPEKQQLLRHQLWFGYWIGPEDVDGWGFVEAYLLPI